MQQDIVFNPAHELFDVWAWPAGRAEPPVLLGAALTYDDGQAAVQALICSGGAQSAAWRVLVERGGTPNTTLLVRGARWPDAVRRHQGQRLVQAQAAHHRGEGWDRVTQPLRGEPTPDLRLSVARAAERLGLWTPDELAPLTPRQVCRRLAVLTSDQRKAQLGLLATTGGWVSREAA